MFPHFAAFLAVSAVVICTPGPDTALTIKNSLSGGRRGGVSTAGGVALGQLIWTLATGAGVVGLLVASEWAFQALKLIGACYLIALGAQLLVVALLGKRHGTVPAVRRGLPARRAFRQGLVNDLANPKMAAFFVSLLPQFVSSHPLPLLQFLVLGLAFSVMTFVWLSGYAALIARASHVLDRSRLRRSVDSAAGAVLVLFGIRLSTANSP